LTKFIVTVRSVSGASFGGDLGKIRYLAVADEASQPAPSDEVSLKVWLSQIMATFTTGPNGAEGDVVMFVHGFNEDAEDVVTKHQDIANGLASNDFPCTLISFDWPSEGTVFAYLEDAKTAKLTAVDFVTACVKPLLDRQTPTCRVSVHAICHSMGAYVVREALDHADDGVKTSGDWTLNQLVLVAGDVEAEDFVAGNKNTDSMLLHCYRLTNYFNRYDAALQVSNAKRIGIAPRVGRVGLPPNAPQKTVNVDCSLRFQNFVAAEGSDVVSDVEQSHGWYFSDPNFYADLAATLQGSNDRMVIAGRSIGTDGALILRA
jgi:esterase/lipase superfamily enzyme